ncbi:MAG: 1-deoxy-D-xylulose-5-phosphate synthase [Candidatus Goldbacteria bacterium]|nr:1-deoxy-D-xylulose-5-phosphate synthase [Candidatus Goldiibacteriota bacterium]
MIYKILTKITSPDDLKKLSFEQLEVLATEIRDYIVNVVSKTGGHLASSLGAVEITLALYKVFNPPYDKIIWDVGHQAYCHKIVTGRMKKFKTLRQKNGISGFLKPTESKYDIFGAGHSSTSISAALGFAKARDLNKERYEVVAVIGDASLANGMALEAINHLGHDKTKMLIVVIDNEMSISPTVGALAEYFNRLMSGGFINKLRNTIQATLQKIPAIGYPTTKIIMSLEEGIKSIFSPGIIFDELGIRYFGPINGHNIKLLVETLKNIKNINGPKLLHIVTKKGKGYKPAEENPTMFHGISSFDPATGIPICKSMSPTYSKIFSDSLIKLAAKDKKIIAIVAAMIEGTNLSVFKEKFPDRFFDVGIAEEHAVTFAAGLAKAGFKPFVCIYSTFLQRGFDQIIHDVGIQKLPVVFVMDRAGLVGEDGATHHGVFDIAFMKMIPNMIVMAPSDANELQKMVSFAANYKKGPVSIRFPRGESYYYHSNLQIKLGKARIIKKGNSLTILNFGALLPKIIKTIEKIGDKNKIEIIDVRFLKPIDEKTIIKSIKKTKKVITIEEGVIHGGFGETILRIISENNLKNIKVKQLGIPDKFIEHGTVEECREEAGLTENNFLKHIKEFLKL